MATFGLFCLVLFKCVCVALILFINFAPEVQDPAALPPIK